MRKCANTCDTYVKKKLLVKIFAGSRWENKLLEFVDVFTKRRGEFEFALTIHTTIGVDVANQKLDTIAQRVNIMVQLFKEFATPQQKELATMMGEMDRTAVLENKQAMKKLAGSETALTANPGQTKPGRDRPFDLTELQQEIKSDPEEAIKKNAEFFDRKFDIQRRQIVEEIARTVGREGDRIISAVTSGPHDRIVDPDIYSIWKDMGWRGSVKARHFVMALKDYYVEKTAGSLDSASGSDVWALKYINISRAQELLEAFDDDASGFVTVNEVNNFTQSRPRDWSLPHWIAYWAIGWQMTCTKYCTKIEEIFDAMIRLSHEVLAENRQAVVNYVHWSWRQVTAFVQSIEREEGTDDLRSKFEPHVIAEEARLQQNFEEIKCRIDSSDTFRVIFGKGRIEMTLFPTLYLALKRGLEKISLARKYILSENELWEALDTINSVVDVACDRIKSLRDTFKQQNLEAKAQFEKFAKGLYKIGGSHGVVVDGDRLRDIPDPIPCRDETIPDPDSVPLSILNHPIGKRYEPNVAAYGPPELASCLGEGTHPVLGVYYGFIYQNGQTVDPMMKFTFSKGEGDNTFTAAGSHFRDITYMDNYELTGTWDSPLEDGKVPVEMKITYSTADSYTTDLKGVFDPEENSLKGTTVVPYWGMTGEFLFKQDTEFVRFYPAPSLVNARERWAFAAKSILDRIRRQAWSSKRIFKKIKDGKRFMELVPKRYYGRLPTQEEMNEYYASLPSIYEADAQFYASLIKINLRGTTIFGGVSCDNCDAYPIGGSRIICMDCRGDSTVDLCSEPECVNSAVTFEQFNRTPHLPNHRMFKVYRIVFDRDVIGIEEAAEDALTTARKTLSQLEEEDGPMPECAYSDCKIKVSPPCWYCMDCKENNFICDNCERSHLVFNEAHTKLHTVVRVTKEAEKERSVEERLQFLEEKLGKIEQILGKLVEGGNEPLTKDDLRAAVVEVESAQSDKKPEETGDA